MTIHNHKVPTISEYEYREISFDMDDRPLIAESLDRAKRTIDLSDPSTVNEPLILGMW